MKNLILIIALLLSNLLLAQDEPKLPYNEIPEYSEEFTAGTMAARMIDALGFRYYWASDSLTVKDLEYKANEEGRSTEATIKHIYDLSKIIVNSTLKEPNTSRGKEELSYEAMRAKTLTNLKTAADILRESDDISQFKIIFGEQEIPFWNQVNGPIADAIWHCGQIVIYRRTTGNPINPKVNHFTGKVRK
ncbi:hypothetical protein H8K90_12930 [Winogradskyella echinorum]|uniref:DinB superfamily protein n=1 Tax=Winogradskyella echinorum TaxID=538189 RepID=A0ABR6Y3N9_9FLAO|nr:hypothetical protein [Winogradskyella echinorum]MBC3847294.1 hypothetical protein [Winogradskyella echinorum]MBC5751642.1 hypothetical protein [Winogradskyella echinorum]